MNKEKPIWEQLGYDFDPPYPASTPVITNYDRVISKTPEELAEIFYTGCESRAYNDNCLVTQELIERGDLTMSDEEQDEICLKCWLSWLKSPVEETE